MWLSSFLRCLDADRPRARARRRWHRTAPVRFVPLRLLLQPLEDRALPSLVGPPSFDFGTVNPRSVAVGEFNGDGVPDLATANSASNGTVSVLLGNGDGTFQAARTFAAGTYPFHVVVGEFNGDGRQDLAVANEGNTVSVFLGNGDGTFQTARNFAVGTTALSVAVGEFNGDGRQDLAVANRDTNNVSVLVGNGDGTFQAARNFAAGSWPYSVAVGEFNGDGRADLATANLRGNTVSVLLGNGDGTFQTARNFVAGANPYCVAVGEFNGDGRPDLAVANSAELGGTPGIGVLLGNGDGTFQSPRHFAAGSTPMSVAVADVNGDGRSDLAAANFFSGTVSVLLGNGDGTFQTAHNFAVGTRPTSVAVGEFNGDGRLDLAVANRDSWTVSVRLGNGVGAFDTPGHFAVGSNPNAVAVGEFNGDGLPDLAVANSAWNGTVSVLLGNRDATFQPAQTFATGAAPCSVAVGDFNNDGKLDLATANSGGNDLSVLLGNGNGTFQPPASIPLSDGSTPSSVAVGDFNGDGKMDLGVTSRLYVIDGYTIGYYGGSYPYGHYEGHANVLMGNGVGAFGPQNTAQLNSSSPMGLAAADLNGDGKLDVVTANYDYGTVSVLLGTGTGTLGPPSDFAAGYYPVSVTAADVDGDGDIDLATANRYGNNVSVLLGNGAGAFGAPQNYVVGSEPASVVFSDFSNDGKLDIATANFAGNSVTVLLGRGDGAFSRPLNTQSGSGASAVVAGDFNGDGWLDAASANYNRNNVSVLINDQIWSPPDAPSLSISDVTLTEGNTGTANATFTVSLSAAYGQPISVHYAMADGTAAAGSDYTAVSGDVTFTGGQTSKTISVAVIGDRLAEANETFFVSLSSPTNAVIDDGQGVGTIVDDEPRIAINDVTITEGNSGTANATFTVSLSVAYDVPVTVHYATANGSGASGGDYTATSGDVSFGVRQTIQTFTVAVIGDRLPEDTETFIVDLSSPTNSTIADGQGVGTILDDEPRINIGDVTRLEGKNRHTTHFVFTVTLSTAYDQPVTMSFATANGTATTSNGDYVAKTGTLTFAPGETTKTITIEVKGDNRQEANETFYLDLFGNPDASLFTKNRGLGTILNDD
jgi:Calx-beta domain/FG-GAP-like repeat/FG-GAP repeat